MNSSTNSVKNKSAKNEKTSSESSDSEDSDSVSGESSSSSSGSSSGENEKKEKKIVINNKKAETSNVSHFSVMRSGNGGLRMKIAAIPQQQQNCGNNNNNNNNNNRKCTSNKNNNNNNKDNNNNNSNLGNTNELPVNATIQSKNKINETDSSSIKHSKNGNQTQSNASSSSEDDDDDDEECKQPNTIDSNASKKHLEHLKTRKKRRKSKSVAKSSNNTSTDSDVNDANCNATDNPTTKSSNREFSTKSSLNNKSSPITSDIVTSILPSTLSLPNETLVEYTTTPTASLSSIEHTITTTVTTTTASIIATTMTTSAISNSSSIVNNNILIDVDDCDGGASSSDIELPDLVNAAIQRVEMESDADDDHLKMDKSLVKYTSSLLREFVVKTQMLGTPQKSPIPMPSPIINDFPSASETTIASGGGVTIATQSPTKSIASTITAIGREGCTSSPTTSMISSADDLTVKRKRGRPRKKSIFISEIIENKNTKELLTNNTIATPISQNKSSNTTTTTDKLKTTKLNRQKQSTSVSSASVFSTPPRVTISSNSTISNTPQRNAPKLNLTALEKPMYATERVLYPPPPRRQSQHNTRKHSIDHKSSNNKSQSNNMQKFPEQLILDPLWRKIDINKKFRRPSISSGYKSDGYVHGSNSNYTTTICSKILAAQSDFLSNSRNSNMHSNYQRMLSGYKTDYSYKSKRSGYKTDYSTKAKSCGYRSDCSTKHRRKIRRKRRLKIQSTTDKKSMGRRTPLETSNNTDVQDILQLAGLSLGQSSEDNSSRDSIDNNNKSNLYQISNNSSSNLTKSDNNFYKMSINNSNNSCSDIFLNNSFVFNTNNNNNNNNNLTTNNNNTKRNARKKTQPQQQQQSKQMFYSSQPSPSMTSAGQRKLFPNKCAAINSIFANTKDYPINISDRLSTLEYKDHSFTNLNRNVPSSSASSIGEYNNVSSSSYGNKRDSNANVISGKNGSGCSVKSKAISKRRSSTAISCCSKRSSTSRHNSIRRRGGTSGSIHKRGEYSSKPINQQKWNQQVEALIKLYSNLSICKHSAVGKHSNNVAKSQTSNSNAQTNSSSTTKSIGKSSSASLSSSSSSSSKPTIVPTVSSAITNSPSQQVLPPTKDTLTNVANIVKVVTKRLMKKRKITENADINLKQQSSQNLQLLPSSTAITNTIVSSVTTSVTSTATSTTTTAPSTSSTTTTTTTSSATTTTTTTKRRNKKNIQTNSNSPDDHKLPLKKRHYLLTPGEKSSSNQQQQPQQSEPHHHHHHHLNHIDGISEKQLLADRLRSQHIEEAILSVSVGAGGPPSSALSNQMGTKLKQNIPITPLNTPPVTVVTTTSISNKTDKSITTPKKRHLLDTTNSVKSTATANQQPAIDRDQSVKDNNSLLIDKSNSIQQQHQHQQQQHQQQQQQHNRKNDIITRKKNRLEGVLSKIMPNNIQTNSFNSTSNSSSSNDSLNQSPTISATSTATPTLVTVAISAASCATTTITTSVATIVTCITTSTTTTKSILSNITTASSAVKNVNITSTSLPLNFDGSFDSIIDIETQIPISCITTSSAMNAKLQNEIDPTTISKAIKDEPPTTKSLLNAPPINVVSADLNSNPNISRKKRKKANRTGFPTVRRKRKKISENEQQDLKTTVPDLLNINDNKTLIKDTEQLENGASQQTVQATSKSSTSATSIIPLSSTESLKCDLAAKDGETTETPNDLNVVRPRVTVVSLEKLQGKSNVQSKSPTSISGQRQSKPPTTTQTTAHTTQNILNTIPTKRTSRNSIEASSYLLLNGTFDENLLLTKHRSRSKQRKKQTTNTAIDNKNTPPSKLKLSKKHEQVNKSTSKKSLKHDKELEKSLIVKKRNLRTTREQSSDNEPLINLILNRKSSRNLNKSQKQIKESTDGSNRESPTSTTTETITISDTKSTTNSLKIVEQLTDNVKSKRLPIVKLESIENNLEELKKRNVGGGNSSIKSVDNLEKLTNKPDSSNSISTMSSSNSLNESNAGQLVINPVAIMDIVKKQKKSSNKNNENEAINSSSSPIDNDRQSKITAGSKTTKNNSKRKSRNISLDDNASIMSEIIKRRKRQLGVYDDDSMDSSGSSMSLAMTLESLPIDQRQPSKYKKLSSTRTIPIMNPAINSNDNDKKTIKEESEANQKKLLAKGKVMDEHSQDKSIKMNSPLEDRKTKRNTNLEQNKLVIDFDKNLSKTPIPIVRTAARRINRSNSVCVVQNSKSSSSSLYWRGTPPIFTPLVTGATPTLLPPPTVPISTFIKSNSVALKTDKQVGGTTLGNTINYQKERIDDDGKNVIINKINENDHHHVNECLDDKQNSNDVDDMEIIKSMDNSDYLEQEPLPVNEGCEQFIAQDLTNIIGYGRASTNGRSSSSMSISSSSTIGYTNITHNSLIPTSLTQTEQRYSVSGGSGSGNGNGTGNGNGATSNNSTKKQSKCKKKYLVAGLFSNYYKISQSTNGLLTTTTTVTPSNNLKSSQGYNRKDFPNGLLPPPPYCERYFRRTQQDFLLPYDIWWAHVNEKLPSNRNSVPSWNYRKIRTNVYGDVRPTPSVDQQACSCKVETLCGDDCLNRLVYTECSPETCPCKDKCKNTKIQRHTVAPGVQRFMTDHKGWGVRTKLPIKKGTYILEYVGEVVTEREFKERMATLYIHDIHHYCLNLDGGLVIDGHRMGSDGRFVNHSCLPNCEMQKWSVNGLFRMALFAARDIHPDEELTYDYNFSLFNPAEGQPCRCETPQCRGVIGGKSQRIKPIESSKGMSSTTTTTKSRSGRPRKMCERKNELFMHNAKDGSMLPPFQPPTIKEKLFIRNGNMFLLRNLKKINRLKSSTKLNASGLSTQPGQSGKLTAQISALRAPRNIRTRGLTLAEHDPTVERTARIAGILREICEELSNSKDKSGQNLITKINLPSKKKLPAYYELILKPIDLSTIEINVEKGVYTKPELFDDDILKMLSNVVKFYGIASIEGDVAQQLLTIYSKKKEDVVQRLTEIIGTQTWGEHLKTFLPNRPNLLLLNIDPNEDIIQCICGLFKDEGLMIQCSKCLVWQHTECTDADTSIDNYLCEKCAPRSVDYEIKLNEYTDEGYQYYLSLMRGDLQIRQSDTVYVLRDIPIKCENADDDDDDADADTDKTNDSLNVKTKSMDSIQKPTKANENLTKLKKHTYETIGNFDYSECDIFRVERLWKDDNGRRFVFGHHYLRPHETYHEPTRKFYQNEVVRVPLYEVVPIELIMGRCWVLDPTTFCKGRPINCIEQHVYICELRVDKAARLFSKISKHSFALCTKSYAFRKFEQKLKISRNYLPHDVNFTIPKPKKRKEENATTVTTTKKNTQPTIIQLMPPPPKTLNEKRLRLDGILILLMNKLKSLTENTQPVDLSYLLTGRGARRRANTTNTNVPI